MSQTILLIDDDVSLLKLLGMYLEKAGYYVLRANRGLTGIQALSEHRPNLIVLDLMMPYMDGWETCRRIRQVSDVPIIMFTAQSYETGIRKGLQLGADNYITKPFGFAELTARIGVILAECTSGEKFFDNGERP